MSRTRRTYRPWEYQWRDQTRDGSGKGCGYEYWSRRRFAGCSPGSAVKRMTNRVERRTAKHALPGWERGYEELRYTVGESLAYALENALLDLSWLDYENWRIVMDLYWEDLMDDLWDGEDDYGC